MKKYLKTKILNAFTLAEVLITLGIIGVVASITIPTLMNSMQENNYKVAYKKAFSVASQAWQHALGDNNIEYVSDWNNAQTRIDNFNAFKSYFKISKECNNSNNSECWDTNGEKWAGNLPDSTALAFVDSAGMAWSLHSNLDGVGPAILVDTNAFKGPNKYGYDRFILYPRPIDGVGTTGMFVKLMPRGDENAYNSSTCISGNTHPCLYTSWLYN